MLDDEAPQEVFVLQTWIAPRTITGEGYWSWSLAEVFTVLHEAETERAEFHFEDERTRIVKMELREIEVVAEFPMVDSTPTVAAQKRLF